MVKKISSFLAVSNTTTSKVLDKILALKAEVSRLRHHVYILSKWGNKLDPPLQNSCHVDSSPSPAIEEVTWRSTKGGKTVESEGVAGDIGGSTMAVAATDDVAMATFEAGAVAVEFRSKRRRRLEDKERAVEEDVVV